MLFKVIQNTLLIDRDPCLFINTKGIADCTHQPKGLVAPEVIRSP